ncbi:MULTISPECIES: large conductance mechanosensitive channel protein MscL [unclassified Pseudoclavibacter]|uniref:large conductance mechanosensitive channel protein MscL n=1 Tax=unclassified Pseudoclavibacter TaxID=2615177 RepID=UPI0012F2A6A1|nr:MULTISPECIES: large conductance mechanosensitive channel protein MscL [unclassified Pseudoclavibacter]MBF4459881.1 large conductance mechanosensitive channel protein MscL [Pseudoclavibacter sp. VKM Ac-2867]VXB73906.1 Large-conductance mechanosensitive channel [Pseudoclavibacter sp. 8L]
MKGFREFIMRGNVIELAVAVIIGAAFTSIVNAIVDGIFNPIIAKLFAADDIAAATVTIGTVPIGFGAVIAAIIQFVLIAAVVYFAIILPINKLNDMSYRLIHGKPKPAVEAAVTEKDVLEEIRDLLKAQQEAPAKLQGEGPETRS